jgi:hypothetical protein
MLSAIMLSVISQTMSMRRKEAVLTTQPSAVKLAILYLGATFPVG